MMSVDSDHENFVRVPSLSHMLGGYRLNVGYMVCFSKITTKAPTLEQAENIILFYSRN